MTNRRNLSPNFCTTIYSLFVTLKLNRMRPKNLLLNLNNPKLNLNQTRINKLVKKFTQMKKTTFS